MSACRRLFRAAVDRMSRPPSRSGCSPVLGDSLTAEQYPTSTRPTRRATAVVVSTDAAAGRGPTRAACRRATTSATRPAQRRLRIDAVRDELSDEPGQKNVFMHIGRQGLPGSWADGARSAATSPPRSRHRPLPTTVAEPEGRQRRPRPSTRTRRAGQRPAQELEDPPADPLLPDPSHRARQRRPGPHPRCLSQVEGRELARWLRPTVGAGAV
jgi:hypothetical protein